MAAWRARRRDRDSRERQKASGTSRMPSRLSDGRNGHAIRYSPVVESTGRGGTCSPGGRTPPCSGPWIAVDRPQWAGSLDRALAFSIGMYLRVVAFRFEVDLREPVATWLRDAGFDVRIEVPILGRRADLVGSRGTSVTAIEMKMHRWAEALRQAIAYQLAADRVWVAMPLDAACRAYRQRWNFQSEGVGLLAVDDRGRVRSPILAAPSPRLLPYVREKVLKSCRTDALLTHSSGEARTLVRAPVGAPDASSGGVPSCQPALARVSESE